MGKFRVGDLVVYPAQGVTEITAIETRDIDGVQHIFYVLRVVGSEKKILVPIGKEEHVGLRHVMSREDVNSVFDVLRERNMQFEQETWNRRSRRYMDKIGSGDPVQLAEVLRDFSVLKGEKVLSFGERKMLEMARSLMTQELCVALDKSESEMDAIVEDAFSDIDAVSNE